MSVSLETRSYCASDYYESLYDPCFFGHYAYVSHAGSSAVTVSRLNGIEWSTWVGVGCSVQEARALYAQLFERRAADWTVFLGRYGQESWSLVALLCGEEIFRTGGYERLDDVCCAIETYGASTVRSRAVKLRRAARAMLLLSPRSVADYGRYTTQDAAEDAVSFVLEHQTSDSRVSRDLVRVETPVRLDFCARHVDLANECEVLSFYQKTYSYILELTAANYQVETLNNYVSCLDVAVRQKKRRLYDHGGGIGTLALLAKKMGVREVTLADLNGPTLDFAKKRSAVLGADLKFETLDGRRVPSLSDVDVVCCTEVVEHVFDPERLLRTLTSLLAKDGLFIVSESFDYIEDFCTHLPQHRGRGGRNFIRFMQQIGFRPLEETSDLHCRVFVHV